MNKGKVDALLGIVFGDEGKLLCIHQELAVDVHALFTDVKGYLYPLVLEFLYGFAYPYICHALS